MEAVIQAFINSILDYSKAQLFDLCIQLKRDDYAKEIRIKEYSESDKAMARDYQHALQKIKDLEEEILDLKKALERTSSQKDLLNRYRFGSHNEKIRALHASSGEDIQDPISEDQVPDETQRLRRGPRESCSLFRNLSDIWRGLRLVRTGSD